MEGKNCSLCFQFKSYDNYYTKSSLCKLCSNKKSKEYNKLHKDIIKDYQMEYRKNNKEKITITQWKKNGIRSENFHKLFKIFNKAMNCYFCNVQFGNTTRNRKCLDHDHLSGYPRFILCNICNTKLRKIDDKRKDVLLEIRRYHDRCLH